MKKNIIWKKDEQIVILKLKVILGDNYGKEDRGDVIIRIFH